MKRMSVELGIWQLRKQMLHFRPVSDPCIPRYNWIIFKDNIRQDSKARGAGERDAGRTVRLGYGLFLLRV